MISNTMGSNTSAGSTSSDAATSILTIPAATRFNNLILTNTGSTAGFLSVDGGTSWHYFTGGTSNAPGGLFLNNLQYSPGQTAGAVQVKNAVSGQNLSGLYVSMI